MVAPTNSTGEAVVGRPARRRDDFQTTDETMKHHEIRRDDGRVVFGATDDMVGYGVLAVLLVLVGGSLLWWWPGDPGQLIRPWTREQWNHPEALIYAISVAVFGGLVVLAGGFVSDRGRRHELEFAASEQVVSIRERWRGVEVELELLFGLFSNFEVHRPADGSDVWQLGIVLENGSYWRLDRNSDRDELDREARRLNETMEFGETARRADVEIPERLEVEETDSEFTVRWDNRERPVARGLMTVATLLFSVALLIPVLAVFEGATGPLVGALAAGTALFAVPLFGSFSSAKTIGPFLAGWFVAVLGAVMVLDAHWAYFPVATAGVAIFSRSTATIVGGFWNPEIHSLKVDEEGRIYEDGEMVETEEGEVVRAADLEGALANVTEVRPPTVELVRPGGRAENRARYLNRESDGEEAAGEPVELETPGLSLFELVAVALRIDELVERR